MNLAQLYLLQADRLPEKTAIYFGDARISYSEIRTQAGQVAHWLVQEAGIQPGDRVGLWMRNRPEFVIALLGALAAGAVVVPINNFLKTDEVRHMVEDSGLRAMLSEDSMAEIRNAIAARHPTLSWWSADSPVPANTAPSDLKAIPRSTDDLAALIYTSGTTGQPKGAMLTHGNLAHNVASCRELLEVVDLDRFVLMLPMFHSFMLTVSILLPLFAGGSIVLLRSLHPAKAMLAELIANQGTVMPAMAQVFRALTATPAGIPLPLRLCISGAGPLPASILSAFQNRFPHIPLIEGYGLSEASPVVSVNPPHGPAIPGTIGLPIPHVEMSVQDDDGHPLPDGVDGEICVRGGNVMVGYWNDATKSAEVLRHGWLLTGDIGHRRPDGYYVITDRKKDMLKPNGMNVYPREIEEVLYRFPGIHEAAVVGEPDERRGERPVAFVSMDEGVAFDEPALLAYLKEHLADYKLPRRAIALPALPRNATGKILKTRLRDLLRDPAHLPS